jgi:uncharacterized protein
MESVADLVAGRDRWVRSARGPLALVNAQQVDHAQPVWPVPGQWAPATGGLTVTATADLGVVVDGTPVDGTVLVAGDDAVIPSEVLLPDGMQATVARTASGHALRVWDPASTAIERFGRIDRFAESEAWVVSARFRPVTDGLEARGDVVDAAGDRLPVAGTIAVTLPGEDAERELLAVRSAAYRGVPRLQVVFQDATSALPEAEPGSSYSMGRFLYLDDPGAEADVTLDWNRAVLPPCAFSYQFACPIPPEQNRLAIAVRAGERHGIDVDGTVAH